MSENEKSPEDIDNFIARFEHEIDQKLKAMGSSHLVWVNEPDFDESHDVSPQGNCASQADCGGNRCKNLIDECAVRYCRRRHICGVNCQVGNTCGVKYCHGRCISGRT